MSRCGFLIEYAGDFRLTPRQRSLLKDSWLAREAGDFVRGDALRERARKLGHIRNVQYRSDGNIWVAMDYDKNEIPPPTYLENPPMREEIIERNAREFAERYKDFHE